MMTASQPRGSQEKIPQHVIKKFPDSRVVGNRLLRSRVRPDDLSDVGEDEAS